MAGKCGCAGTTCSCKVIGEGAVTVTGAGSSGNPYRIAVALALHAFDSPTINLSLLGDGSSSNPYSLTAEATLNFGDLLDVDTAVTTVGYVPARQGDGTFAMVPPSTAAAGTISVGPSIEGDGSSGDILDVRLAANSGLLIESGGLRVDPYTVTSESELDTLYGALDPGTVVTAVSGSGMWVKTTGGWATILEDTGNVTTVSGNATARSGFEILTFHARRKNGIVTISLQFRTLVSRTSGVDSGNMSNIPVLDVLQTKFRPILATPIRVTSTGTDEAFYLNNGGVLTWSNMAQPDVTLPAGYTWLVNTTFIGA